jgi:hypothetical protein
MRAVVALALLIWLALQAPLAMLVGRALRRAGADSLTPYICPECLAPLTSTHVCKDSK